MWKSPRLALGDVVNLEDLWFDGVDSDLGEHGDHPLIKA